MRRRELLLGLGALTAGGTPARSGVLPFRIVVHPGLGVGTASRKELAAIFLRKADKWRDGTSAAPVDQSVRASVRAAFSAEVLGESLFAVQGYWKSRLAGGGSPPPPVRVSDADVLEFVAATPGAVGYVSETVALPPTVKALALE